MSVLQSNFIHLREETLISKMIMVFVINTQKFQFLRKHQQEANCIKKFKQVVKIDLYPNLILEWSIIIKLLSNLIILYYINYI